MFIKRTKVNNVEYIQITKSYRVGKKVKHKVILSLGRSDKITAKDLDGLICVLQKLRTEYTDG
jgi:hypothetical protein